MSCPKVDMTPAATCRSVNHTLTHREANVLELALSRSHSPHNRLVCYISTYIYATVTVLLTLRSIFSIFHLGLIRGERAYCPDAARRGAVGPHPLLKPLPTGAEL